MYDDLTTVTEAVLARPATLGRTRLVCIDGPAGSGKTTLAGHLEQALTSSGCSTATVHMDDLYDGWSGLATVEDRVRRWLIEPLGAGRSAVYRRYDWADAAYAERHTVPVVDALVLEGVGSGCARHAEQTTLLVWVEAPRELRLRRGLERDGAALEGHWRDFLVQEAAFHEQDRTRSRADVLVDGTSGRIGR
jgi:energy-coupling factor transporter ATP-binding protein EcfA2